MRECRRKAIETADCDKPAARATSRMETFAPRSFADLLIDKSSLILVEIETQAQRGVMKPLAVCVCSALLGSFSLAGAQTLINDNFNTNPTNPNTVGWYSSAGTVTTFSATTGALQFTQGDTSNNVSVFKQFTPTTLAVGETLQLSFVYTGFTLQPATLTNSHFRIGLFDTSNTFTSNQGLTPWSTTNEGYTMGVGTGSATATSNFFYRSGNAGIVSTGAPSVGLGTADTLQMSSTPLPVTVNYTITRQSATEMLIAGSFTQNSVTYTLTSDLVTLSANYVDTFDTLFIGYGTSAIGRGFTIDNVNLSVVPEPSTATLLLALGAFATFRRKPSRRS